MTSWSEVECAVVVDAAAVGVDRMLFLATLSLKMELLTAKVPLFVDAAVPRRRRWT